VDLVRQRLRNQRLIGTPFATPVETVRWFGAVQAQDFDGALWAVGLRTKGATYAAVEQALIDRVIVRSWPLRGTLHFVAADDLRWMLATLAPRIVASTTRRLTAVELDARTLTRCRRIVERSLEGGRQLERRALYQRLESAGVRTAQSRGMHILWWLAHHGVICFGARDGRQHRFALVDDWLPPSRRLDRDEALAELARRYFVSHGPAKADDFRWWSGLDAASARSALEIARPRLQRSIVEGDVYWSGEPVSGNGSAAAIRLPHATLLPPYDEYLVAYRDRSAALDPVHASATRNGIFGPIVMINGKVAGTWARTERSDSVAVATRMLTRPTAAESGAVAAAVERYRAFKRPASAALPRERRSIR
jgi:hypothetical protein